MDARLDQYLARWGLTEPKLLAQSAWSRVYLANAGATQRVLKLLKEGERAEAIGALALRYFDGHGAVRLIDADEHAQLLEYADGEEVTRLVERGRDGDATDVIADVIDALHANATPPPPGIPTLEEYFAPLFERAQRERKQGDASLYVRAENLTRRLLESSVEISVLHGDIHHANIRQSPRGWLAFDPKGIYGDRAYECCNVLHNPVMPELVFDESRLLRTAQRLAGRLDLNVERILGFSYAYGARNAAATLAVGLTEMAAWSLRAVHLIEPLLAPGYRKS